MAENESGGYFENIDTDRAPQVPARESKMKSAETPSMIERIHQLPYFIYDNRIPPERLALLQTSRPTPLLPKLRETVECSDGSQRTLRFTLDLYDKYLWLTGCTKTQRLYCWPCLLLSCVTTKKSAYKTMWTYSGSDKFNPTTLGAHSRQNYHVSVVNAFQRAVDILREDSEAALKVELGTVEKVSDVERRQDRRKEIDLEREYLEMEQPNAANRDSIVKLKLMEPVRISNTISKQRIEIARLGRPRPSMPFITNSTWIRVNGRYVEHRRHLYDDYDWIAGCPHKRRLFCWPCVFFGDKSWSWTNEGSVNVADVDNMKHITSKSHCHFVHLYKQIEVMLSDVNVVHLKICGDEVLVTQSQAGAPPLADDCESLPPEAAAEFLCLPEVTNKTEDVLVKVEQPEFVSADCEEPGVYCQPDETDSLALTEFDYEIQLATNTLKIKTEDSEVQTQSVSARKRKNEEEPEGSAETKAQKLDPEILTREESETKAQKLGPGITSQPEVAFTSNKAEELGSMTSSQRIELLLKTSFKDNDASILLERLKIFQLSRPTPSIIVLKSMAKGKPKFAKIDRKIYDKIPWIAGCAKSNKLFCWACLLFSSSKSLWNTKGTSYMFELAKNVSLHVESPPHVDAVASCCMVEKLLKLHDRLDVVADSFCFYTSKNAPELLSLESAGTSSNEEIISPSFELETSDTQDVTDMASYSCDVAQISGNVVINNSLVNMAQISGNVASSPVINAQISGNTSSGNIASTFVLPASNIAFSTFLDQPKTEGKERTAITGHTIEVSVENFLKLPLLENKDVLSRARFEVLQLSRPTPILDAPIQRVNSLYCRYEWLTACEKTNQLYCWPCLLLHTKHDYVVRALGNVTHSEELTNVSLPSHQEDVRHRDKFALWKCVENTMPDAKLIVTHCPPSVLYVRGDYEYSSPAKHSIDKLLQLDSIQYDHVTRERLQIFNVGQPKPPIAMDYGEAKSCNVYLKCISSEYYVNHPWLAGCDVRQRLFCWPCLLCSVTKCDWSSAGVRFDLNNLETYLQHHSTTVCHINAIKLYNAIGKMQLDPNTRNLELKVVDDVSVELYVNDLHEEIHIKDEYVDGEVEEVPALSNIKIESDEQDVTDEAQSGSAGDIPEPATQESKLHHDRHRIVASMTRNINAHDTIQTLFKLPRIEKNKPFPLEVLDIIKQGRPTPTLNNFLRGKGKKTRNIMFNDIMYTSVHYMCGCPIKNRLFCWPCLLFSNVRSCWNREGIDRTVCLKARERRHVDSLSHQYAYEAYLELCKYMRSRKYQHCNYVIIREKCGRIDLKPCRLVVKGSWNLESSVVPSTVTDPLGDVPSETTDPLGDVPSEITVLLGDVPSETTVLLGDVPSAATYPLGDVPSGTTDVQDYVPSGTARSTYALLEDVPLAATGSMDNVPSFPGPSSLHDVPQADNTSGTKEEQMVMLSSGNPRAIDSVQQLINSGLIVNDGEPIPAKVLDLIKKGRPTPAMDILKYKANKSLRVPLDWDSLKSDILCGCPISHRVYCWPCLLFSNYNYRFGTDNMENMNQKLKVHKATASHSYAYVVYRRITKFLGSRKYHNYSFTITGSKCADVQVKPCVPAEEEDNNVSYISNPEAVDSVQKVLDLPKIQIGEPIAQEIIEIIKKGRPTPQISILEHDWYDTVYTPLDTEIYDKYNDFVCGCPTSHRLYCWQCLLFGKFDTKWSRDGINSLTQIQSRIRVHKMGHNHKYTNKIFKKLIKLLNQPKYENFSFTIHGRNVSDIKIKASELTSREHRTVRYNDSSSIIKLSNEPFKCIDRNAAKYIIDICKLEKPKVEIRDLVPDYDSRNYKWLTAIVESKLLFCWPCLIFAQDVCNWNCEGLKIGTDVHAAIFNHCVTANHTRALKLYNKISKWVRRQYDQKNAESFLVAESEKIHEDPCEVVVIEETSKDLLEVEIVDEIISKRSSELVPSSSSQTGDVESNEKTVKDKDGVIQISSNEDSTSSIVIEPSTSSGRSASKSRGKKRARQNKEPSHDSFLQSLLQAPFECLTTLELKDRIELAQMGRLTPALPHLTQTVVVDGEEPKILKFKNYQYELISWLTGCNVRSRLYCWPCILFGKLNKWNKKGHRGLDNLDACALYHSQIDFHKAAVEVNTKVETLLKNKTQIKVIETYLQSELVKVKALDANTLPKRTPQEQTQKSGPKQKCGPKQPRGGVQPKSTIIEVPPQPDETGAESLTIDELIKTPFNKVDRQDIPLTRIATLVSNRPVLKVEPVKLKGIFCQYKWLTWHANKKKVFCWHCLLFCKGATTWNVLGLPLHEKLISHCKEHEQINVHVAATQIYNEEWTRVQHVTDPKFWTQLQNLMSAKPPCDVVTSSDNVIERLVRMPLAIKNNIIRREAIATMKQGRPLRTTEELYHTFTWVARCDVSGRHYCWPCLFFGTERTIWNTVGVDSKCEADLKLHSSKHAQAVKMYAAVEDAVRRCSFDNKDMLLLQYSPEKFVLIPCDPTVLSYINENRTERLLQLPGITTSVINLERQAIFLLGRQTPNLALSNTSLLLGTYYKDYAWLTGNIKSNCFHCWYCLFFKSASQSPWKVSAKDLVTHFLLKHEVTSLHKYAATKYHSLKIILFKNAIERANHRPDLNLPLLVPVQPSRSSFQVQNQPTQVQTPVNQVRTLVTQVQTPPISFPTSSSYQYALNPNQSPLVHLKNPSASSQLHMPSINIDPSFVQLQAQSQIAIMPTPVCLDQSAVLASDATRNDEEPLHFESRVHMQTAPADKNASTAVNSKDVISYLLRDRYLSVSGKVKQERLEMFIRGRPLPTLPDYKMVHRQSGEVEWVKFDTSMYLTYPWLTACEETLRYFCWPCLLFSPSHSHWSSHGHAVSSRATLTNLESGSHQISVGHKQAVAVCHKIVAQLGKCVPGQDLEVFVSAPHHRDQPWISLDNKHSIKFLLSTPFHMLQSRVSDKRIAVFKQGRPTPPLSNKDTKEQCYSHYEMSPWLTSCLHNNKYYCWYCLLFGTSKIPWNIPFGKCTLADLHKYIKVMHGTTSEHHQAVRRYEHVKSIVAKYTSPILVIQNCDIVQKPLIREESIPILLSTSFKECNNTVSVERQEIIKLGKPRYAVVLKSGERPLHVDKSYKQSCHEINSQYYEQIDWLTGCKQVNRLYCWPCLLFNDILDEWNTQGIQTFLSFNTEVYAHSQFLAHKVAVKLYKITTKLLENPKLEVSGFTVTDDSIKIDDKVISDIRSECQENWENVLCVDELLNEANKTKTSVERKAKFLGYLNNPDDSVRNDSVHVLTNKNVFMEEGQIEDEDMKNFNAKLSSNTELWQMDVETCDKCIVLC